MPAKPRRRSREEIRLFGRASDAIDVHNIITAHTIPTPNSIIGVYEKEVMWNFLVSDLSRRGLLSESYSVVMELLVLDLYLMNEYRPALEQAGPLTPIMGRDGITIVDYRPNPLFNMVLRLEAVIVKLLEKLGLTPRDITYVSNPDAQIPIQQIAEEKKRINYFR